MGWPHCAGGRVLRRRGHMAQVAALCGHVARVAVSHAHDVVDVVAVPLLADDLLGRRRREHVRVAVAVR